MKLIEQYEPNEERVALVGRTYRRGNWDYWWHMRDESTHEMGVRRVIAMPPRSRSGESPRDFHIHAIEKLRYQLANEAGIGLQRATEIVSVLIGDRFRETVVRELALELAQVLDAEEVRSWCPVMIDAHLMGMESLEQIVAETHSDALPHEMCEAVSRWAEEVMV